MRNRVLTGAVLRSRDHRNDSNGFRVTARDLLNAARQHDAKDGCGLSRAFHENFAAMILHNFLNYRQPQSRAVLFAVTDERVEQARSNGFGDAGSVVGY